ncbi:MMPL family transporter [Conexibacter stalactiti]|uniref:MMPL family transporter n=1 Tax=Conexibacter stalactiti TaxID=1940611 RepID=A0ABU4HJB9_9ACTN|nr:MMPL family transporter [Conexibacter stalactiti]MDW5593418.1 MMPL family transporter [Conexibacter stalactiti]MEC5034059.1 MMPL family transporter [Conexibacter stalactiti]
MSALLARIARALTHHWKRSLVAALVVVALLGVAAGTGGRAADDFGIPGTETQQALDLFKAHSPAFAGADATVVFSVEDGTLSDGERRAAIEEAIGQIRGLDHVEAVADPFGAGGALSRDGRIANVSVRYDVEATDVEREDGEALEEAARSAESGGVDVSMRGIVVDLGQEQEAPVGELIGVAIAIILLTLLFRSAAAMGATLLGALLGVVIGQILLTALAKPLGLPAFASTIAVMLGLGAGIDYALLIIGRYREQAAAGDSVRDASAKAAATAGASVVAAGLIVMVAIAGLLVIGIPMIGKMGIGAAIGIAAVVVSAITILPIMIGAFAKRLRPKKPEHVQPSPAFSRWGELVTRKPWLSIAGGVVLLLVFAFPVTQMRLGQPDDGNQPTTRTQRIAYDKLSEGFGAGSNGPFLLAVDIPRGDTQTRAQLTRLEQAVGELPGVAAVMPAMVSEDGEMATITAIPTTAPQDSKTSDLLEQMRDETIPAATAETPLKVYVGGNTAGFEDFSAKVASRLPLFIAVVIGLSVLLLMAAFRSLLIPLVSAVFNLLSVLAAYGVVVAVFQEGIGASLIGADTGVPIVSFIPVMIFAILFGLSMDYNVFLLSRIHEAYNEGDAPRASVIHGVSRIGKVILFAGLIMAAVFLAFVTQPDVTAKMMGLGLGLAVLIDVLVVRLVIAPAVVTLMGDRAWWLPGWLDRIMPNVSLEGHLVENVDRPAAEREPTPV